MLPSEQAVGYQPQVSIATNGVSTDYCGQINYSTNAENTIYAFTCSNSKQQSCGADTGLASSWTRYQLHSLTYTFSTTAIGGVKQKLYDNATLVQYTNSSYAVPAGSVPANIFLQRTYFDVTTQAMEYVGLAIFNRVLTAAEVTQVYRYFGGT
jgi:hypothetical protein